MQRQLFFTAALIVAHAPRVFSQDTTGNPLNVFISLAGGAATAIETAVASQTTPPTTSQTTSATSSSTTPASPPASTTSAAPAATSSSAAAAPADASSGGLSHQTLIDIIIPVVIVGVILLALLALCLYCCLRSRRRSKRAATPVRDEEVSTWRRSENPGRVYDGNGSHPAVPMSQQPTVPLMAAAAERPYTAEHPAYRNENAENPFVPVPPSPRRMAPNARAGLTDGIVAGAPAYIEAQHGGNQRLRKSRSTSRSTSGHGLNDGYVNANNGYGNNGNGNGHGYNGNGYSSGAPIGVGLNDPYDKFDNKTGSGNYYNKYGELVAPAIEHGNIYHPNNGNNQTTRKPVLSALDTANRPPTPFGLGALSSNPPRDRRDSATMDGATSPYSRIGSPYNDMHVHHLQTESPSVDLLRTDQTYPAPIPLPTPAQQRSNARRSGFSTPPMVPSRSPNRRSSQFHDSAYDSQLGSHEGSHTGSGSGSSESWRSSQMQPPMVPPSAPWEDRERRYSGGSRERRYSGSPRNSQHGTPTGGTPRRLRFSDVQMEPDHNVRYSQGVGEAM
ncbi:hypothetical protein MMC13_007653 [Lambiella insularis]|nr:hypothetical protein [Lambiella insularis]